MNQTVTSQTDVQTPNYSFIWVSDTQEKGTCLICGKECDSEEGAGAIYNTKTKNISKSILKMFGQMAKNIKVIPVGSGYSFLKLKVCNDDHQDVLRKIHYKTLALQKINQTIIVEAIPVKSPYAKESLSIY